MPRNAKEETSKKEKKPVVTKKSTTKSASKNDTKKPATTKKMADTVKNKTTPSVSKTVKKKEDLKQEKLLEKKIEPQKKKTTNTKNKLKEKTSSSVSTKKRTVKAKPKDLAEYYDLPYTYDQVTIKVLSQTPTTLFVYWEISEKDRKNFEKKYGKDFFSNSKPVLIVRNETLNYSFEVDINDFANSWYLNINDSSCKYDIELGRRFIDSSNQDTNYVYIASSNEIESPNDHILFEKQQNMVYFKNVQTNIITKKNISTLFFIRNIGRIYNIYDLYKKIYQNENISEIDLANPSSGNPTSTFK